MPFGLPGVLPWGDNPYPSAIVHDLVVAAEATSRLVQQYKKPGIQGLVNALALPAQDLEDAIQQVYVNRWVLTATGVQLDVLGAIVGFPRQGLTDDVYRLFIQAQILTNRSSGGPEEIYAIMSLVVPSGTTLRLTYYQPAAFILDLFGPITTTIAQILALLLKAARGAGIGAGLHYSIVPAASTFIFDGTSAQAWNNGLWSDIIPS